MLVVGGRLSMPGEGYAVSKGLKKGLQRLALNPALLRRIILLKKYLKSSLLLSLLFVGACIMAALVAGWWGWHPSTDAPKAITALALKAVAGDPKAVAQLRALGPSAVPGLVRLLEYQDPYLRRKAWALAAKLPRRLGRALLPKAVPLGSSDVRAAGAKALGLLGPQAEAATPDLLRALHDPEQYVAMEAAAALGRIGKPSMAGLTRALADTNAVARRAAAYGLGEVGADAEPAIPELIETLGDRDPAVRSSTSYSLQLIGFPALLALSNVIDHADANARDAAVKEFMGIYRSLRLMAPAFNRMAHAEDVGSRRLALEALGSIRAADDTTVNTFIASLKDPAEEVRLAALKALSLVAWRAEPAVGCLKSCLQDPSPAVRTWAAKDLGAIGPAAASALEDLSGSLRDSDPGARAAGLQAMEKIRAREPGKN
jgi:HEAT repeat protein